MPYRCNAFEAGMSDKRAHGGRQFHLHFLDTPKVLYSNLTLEKKNQIPDFNLKGLITCLQKHTHMTTIQ